VIIAILFLLTHVHATKQALHDAYQGVGITDKTRSKLWTTGCPPPAMLCRTPSLASCGCSVAPCTWPISLAHRRIHGGLDEPRPRTSRGATASASTPTCIRAPPIRSTQASHHIRALWFAAGQS
jgi:hypothetical protein